MTRQLIINADDFGLHPAINAAVRHAHERGVLTHTSIMSRAPAFEQAIEIARNAPTLSVGVHLTLPGQVPGSGLIELLFNSCRYSVTRRYIAEEWRAQINALIENDVSPGHLDSHQHIHLFPGLFPVVLDLASEFNIPRVRMLDLERCAGGEYRTSAVILKLFQSIAVAMSGGKNAAATTPLALGFNESGCLSAARLVQLIDSRRRSNDKVTEIFCHPGSNNSELKRAFHWDYDWRGEMDALCDPHVIAKIEHFNSGKQSSN